MVFLLIILMTPAPTHFVQSNGETNLKKIGYKKERKKRTLISSYINVDTQHSTKMVYFYKRLFILKNKE